MPHQQKALQKYAGHAGDYDRTETDRVAPMRRAVIATLGLKPGHVVLDVGCGTGLSFPLLEESVGPGGRIVGIDQSPDMLLRARARVADRGWQNVTLVEAPAAAAEIPIQADAALFHFTHDIMRTPRAVANVVEHLIAGWPRRGDRDQMGALVAGSCEPANVAACSSVHDDLRRAAGSLESPRGPCP
jgi:SAM-dependent methyltransferase